MFIYSVPILLFHIQLGTPLELILITLFLYILLFIATPFIPGSNDQEGGELLGLSFYKYLLHAWTGQLKLWVVFWPFFIFLNLSLYLTDNLAKQGSFTVSSWDEIHFMLLMPVIFWTMSVWRSSMNTDLRIFAAGARFMTLSVFFEYGLKLLIRKDFPRIFFNCEEVILDYATCF